MLIVCLFNETRGEDRVIEKRVDQFVVLVWEKHDNNVSLVDREVLRNFKIQRYTCETQIKTPKRLVQRA